MTSQIPKTDELRQRRNKASGGAKLPPEKKTRKRAPKLPSDREWNELTNAWWKDIWKSPMATEWLESDKHGLFMLAILVDKYWADPDPKLLSEIRLQRACFGLSPIDRRRLQWEVKRGEDAEGRRKPRRTPGAGDADPRRLLEGVS